MGAGLSQVTLSNRHPPHLPQIWTGLNLTDVQSLAHLDAQPCLRALAEAPLDKAALFRSAAEQRCGAAGGDNDDDDVDEDDETHHIGDDDTDMGGGDGGGHTGGGGNIPNDNDDPIDLRIVSFIFHSELKPPSKPKASSTAHTLAPAAATPKPAGPPSPLAPAPANKRNRSAAAAGGEAVVKRPRRLMPLTAAEMKAEVERLLNQLLPLGVDEVGIDDLYDAIRLHATIVPRWLSHTVAMAAPADLHTEVEAALEAMEEENKVMSRDGRIYLI